VPLAIASGAGSISRQVMGSTVIGGMLVATVIGVYIVPVTFYVMERFAIRFGKHAPTGAAEGGGASGHAPPGNPAGKEGDPHA
jgi:HAE1 family hydrophobic/amphiphilic exporter-1